MKSRKVAKRINRAGRPPRTGVQRHACGKIAEADRLRETEDEILATVLAYRRKLGLSEGQLRDQKAATFLGRLCLTSEITGMQYEAGRRYARTIARYYALEGIPQPWPAPIDLTGAPTGKTSRPEPEQDEIDRVRGDYADMLARLHDLEHAALYRGMSKLLRRVILMDEAVPYAEVGHLRAGLNVLTRLWGMNR